MSKEKNLELEIRGIQAAKNYLQRRGMEVLNGEPFECETGTIEIIAKDEDRGGVAFVKVITRSSSDNGRPIAKADEKKRDRLERIAMAFLESYDETDIGIFFDEIVITVIADDRALIRHHINML